jgi:MFS transporter, DHA1 family, multidrug resistance protein
LLGPLSIDAYLPAFADIQDDFQTSSADLQLTLTGYLLGFACMSLMHGHLSDAFGRRRVSEVPPLCPGFFGAHLEGIISLSR